MLTRDIILFVSKFSNKCKPCLEFSQQSGLPVKTVWVDSPHIRKKLSSGEIKITTVPSLMIIFNDGNLQIFKGMEKIVTWFEGLLENDTPQRKTKNIYDQEGKVIYEQGPYISPTQQNVNKHVNTLKLQKELEHQQDPEYIDESDDDLELIGEDEGDSETEIEFLDEDGMPPKPPTSGLETKRVNNNSMADIMAIAKRMAKEREVSLGYDEKNLPRYE